MTVKTKLAAGAAALVLSMSAPLSASAAIPPADPLPEVGIVNAGGGTAAPAAFWTILCELFGGNCA